MRAVRIISKGGCHNGGRKVRIEGSAPIETSFWPGGPPVVYDPNGDFQAGQMYVQYTRLEAALKNVQNIRGVIMLESSSDMDVNQVDVSAFKDIPFLFVYGDFLGEEYCIEGYKWPGAFAWEGSMRNLHRKLLEMGGDSTWMELPELGIHGNTHALMMEDNSDEIADLICDWMKAHIKE